MQPPAHRPPSPEQLEHWRLKALERDLFFSNLDLIIAHEQEILCCDPYFFCRPLFSGYGVYGYTHINVGTLLLGWREGILIDTCRAELGPRKEKYVCGGRLCVDHFGGLLSQQGFGGYCQSCKGFGFWWDSTLVSWRWDFTWSANQQFKDRIADVEEYSGNTFSFGDPGLVPATKIRPVTRSLVEIVSVAGLVKDLQIGIIKPETSRDNSLVNEFLIVEHGETKVTETISVLK